MNSAEFSRSYAMWKFRSNTKMRFRVYRKLQGMLAMNEALSRALERLWYNSSEMGKYPNRPAAMALREWLQRDRAGDSLSQAMAGWVPSAELYMLRAGEESGTVAKSLRSIMMMGESAKEMRTAVMQAITYPAFMIILISGVLWMFGVNLIQNMRKNAPKAVLESIGPLADVSDFIMKWGIAILLSIGTLAVITSVTMPFWRGKTRAKFDKYPPWSWFRIWQGSGFMLGLSALMGAQVPLRRALEILEQQGNPWIKERIASAVEAVLQGKNLGEALRQGNYGFPDPQVALDMEILSERGDIGSVIEEVTQEWIREQIDELKAQSVVVRNIGLAVVGTVIAFAMSSILHITVVISDSSKGGGSGF
ncbi:MAG: type II secretion system F family protein [Alphaproteobacteria bacterium]